MRLFLLVICSLSLASCGIIHRSANVARGIYSQNETHTSPEPEYLMAFAFWSSPEKNVMIDQNIVEKELESAKKPDEALNNITPAATKDPALYLPNGDIFNPVCLLNNIGTIDVPIHPTSDCGRENIHVIENPTQPAAPPVAPPAETDATAETTAEIAPEAAPEPEPQPEAPAVQAPLTDKIFALYNVDPLPAAVAAQEDEDAPAIDPNAPPPISEISYINLGTVQGRFALRTTEKAADGSINSTIGLYDFSIDSAGKDTLERRTTFAAGDRCNGGVTGQRTNDEGTLFFNVKQTPQSLIKTMLYQNDEAIIDKNLTTLEQLDACPECCVGTQDYIDDVATNFTINESYIASLAGKTYKPQKDDEESIQACFDRILDAIYKSGRTQMSHADLEIFIQGINKNCILPTQAPVDEDPTTDDDEEAEATK